MGEAAPTDWSTAMTALLELRQVSKSYGEGPTLVQALRVDLDAGR